MKSMSYVGVVLFSAGLLVGQMHADSGSELMQAGAQQLAQGAKIVGMQGAKVIGEFMNTCGAYCLKGLNYLDYFEKAEHLAVVRNVAAGAFIVGPLIVVAVIACRENNRRMKSHALIKLHNSGWNLYDAVSRFSQDVVDVEKHCQFVGADEQARDCKRCVLAASIYLRQAIDIFEADVKAYATVIGIDESLIADSIGLDKGDSCACEQLNNWVKANMMFASQAEAKKAQATWVKLVLKALESMNIENNNLSCATTLSSLKNVANCYDAYLSERLVVLAEAFETIIGEHGFWDTAYKAN